MSFVIQTKPLAKALTQLNMIAEQEPGSMLKYVEFSKIENGIKLTAGNGFGKIVFEFKLEKEVENFKPFSVNGMILAKILGKFPFAFVEIIVFDGLSLTIKSSNDDDHEISYSLPFISSVANFLSTEGVWVTCDWFDREVFSQAINNLENLVSRNVSRLALNGIFFEFEAGKFCLTAADGVSLGHFESFSNFEKSEKISFILPLASVAILKNFLVGKESVTILYSPEIKMVSFSFELLGLHIAFYSKIIDDNYANYRQLLPSDSTLAARIVLKISPERLTRMTERAIPALCDSHQPMIISKVLDSLLVTVNQNNTSMDEIIKNKEFQAIKEFCLYLNPSRLLKIVSNLNNECTLYIPDDINYPLYIFSDKSQFLITPMRGE